jgi:hypothetical protein
LAGESPNLFVYPSCSAELRLSAQHGSPNGPIRESQMECAACGAKFPILNWLPRFVPAEDYAYSFGFQWTRYDKQQLDTFMKIDRSRERLFASTQWPVCMQDQLILEAGCCMWRFTQIALETGADVFHSI